MPKPSRFHAGYGVSIERAKALAPTKSRWRNVEFVLGLNSRAHRMPGSSVSPIRQEAVLGYVTRKEWKSGPRYYAVYTDRTGRRRWEAVSK